MIFVTTGTHEEPFDRLISAIDQLKRDDLIHQEVFIQTGYSTYVPDYCLYREFIPFGDMIHYMTEAELVVTHGGTGSIMLALQQHKTPIVVPRFKKYHEHVDDHQVLFCQYMVNKKKILAAYDTSQLEYLISNYSSLALPLQISSREDQGRKTEKFAEKLLEVCKRLYN